MFCSLKLVRNTKHLNLSLLSRVRWYQNIKRWMILSLSLSLLLSFLFHCFSFLSFFFFLFHKDLLTPFFFSFFLSFSISFFFFLTRVSSYFFFLFSQGYFHTSFFLSFFLRKGWLAIPRSPLSHDKHLVSCSYYPIHTVSHEFSIPWKLLCKVNVKIT